MNKVLVVINGCPGSGKSYLSGLIKEKFPFFDIFPYDKVKEEFFDAYGFDNITERSALEERSLEEYYQRLEKRMEKGEELIIEYPFCRKHEKPFSCLIEKYGYRAVTITLIGDLSVLLSRWEERDRREKGRHPGHYLLAYHKGRAIKDSDYKRKPSLEEFEALCRAKDYFITLGETVRVDVTDYSKVDYGQIISLISKNLND